MKAKWLNTLLKDDRLVIHSKHLKWAKIIKYWDKYRLDTVWGDVFYLDSAERAIDKLQALIDEAIV